MQILHLDSSFLENNSVSRALTVSLVAELRNIEPQAQVVYHDLVAEPIAHLDGPIAAGFRPIDGFRPDAAAQAEHSRSDALTSELLASDVVVIGAPMYNFSIPTQLKAWIDRVTQPGRTFRYTPTGPVGLTTGKKVLIASTRGGLYSSGPRADMDHQEAYLKSILGFIGITSVHFIRAERLSLGSDARTEAIQAAHASLPGFVRSALA